MKKVLAILLPIIIIAGGLFLLYKFVLVDMMDPPPDKVMVSAIESAQKFVNNYSETTESEFLSFFSERTRVGLQREWQALQLDGSQRGSWYEMAVGLVNADGSQSTVEGVVESAEEEGEEEEEDEGESELQAQVRVTIDNREREISMIREDGGWRIDIPVAPASRVSLPATE